MSRPPKASLRLAIVLVAAITGAVGLACGAPRSSRPAPSALDEATSFAFRRGVNVNHWLASNYDEAHRYGGPWFDEEDLQWIAAQGFDHVRLRADGQQWVQADGSLDGAKLAPFERALREARRLGLGVVLAMTRFPGGPVPDEETPVELTAVQRGAIAGLWRAVAARYAGEGAQLRFELLHGPYLRDPRQLAEVQAQTLAEVRAVSPGRFVYFTSNRMSFTAAAPLPADPRVGLALMYWEPELFTFQIREELPPVTYPGVAPDFTAAAPPGDPVLASSRRPLAIADLDADFAALAAWIGAHAAGREIYVAQFGVYHRADDDSARRYIRAIRAALDRHQLAWAVYDYESGCAVRGADGKPTRILDALALRAQPVREARYIWIDAGKQVGSGSLRLAGNTIDAAYQLDDGSAGAQLELTLDERGVPRRYVAHAPVPRATPTGASAPAAPAPAPSATAAPRETWQLDGTVATWKTPRRELRALQRNAPDEPRRARWAQLSAVCLELVKLAHDAGVPLVPGTDELLAGFLLRRELSLYVQAGIPPAQALRMATYGAARNMHRERTSSSIAPGKDADLVLIDGDPTQRIADLARVELVVKRGWRFVPAELLRLVSLRDAR